MTALPGTRDLGLAVEWKLGFVGNGSHASTTPGVVYLDVGEHHAPGVIDHHRSREPTCTAELILGRPEFVYNHLMGPWLVRADQGEIAPGTRWTPRLITHVDPDWDGVVAAHLVMRLIEDGSLPPYAQALAAHAREVDQGRAHVDRSRSDAFMAPFLCYLMMQHLESTDHERLMRRGLLLLQRVIEDVTRERAPTAPWTPELFSIDNPAALRWQNDTETFARERAHLLEEPARFARDLAVGRVVEAVALPSNDGGPPITVRAFVAPRPLESALGKYLIRAEGYPLAIVPLGRSIAHSWAYSSVSPSVWEGGTPSPGGAAGHYPRVIISVDSSLASHGRAPNLRGLGLALERAESAARRAQHRGLDDRGTVPRWDDGSCDNGDPWYDGRSHGFGIVDSPRVGTVLDYDAIVRVATSTRFWERELVQGMVALVWVTRPDTRRTRRGTPLPPFEGMATPLEPLYRDTLDEVLQPTGSSPESGITITWRQRHFPQGTAGPFRIVVVSAAAGQTLDALVDAALAAAHEASDEPPAYRFARLALAPQSLQGLVLERELARLRIGAVATAQIGEHEEEIFFNSRSLVLRREVEPNGPDADLELFLYSAFLSETLVALSARVGRAVPDDHSALDTVDTRAIRADMLRFQARYYQVEVSRVPRGRRLFDTLAESIRLREHYEEVQTELERLAEIEQSAADAKSASADRMMEGVLYMLALIGAYQTVIAYVTMDPAARTPRFLVLMGVIGVVAILAYIGIARRRRRRLGKPKG